MKKSSLIRHFLETKNDICEKYHLLHEKLKKTSSILEYNK